MFFNKGITVVEQLNNNKTNDVILKSLNRYGAIGEKLDENNTLTFKQYFPNEKPKTKVSICFN